jgi:hypothetical protein
VLWTCEKGGQRGFDRNSGHSVVKNIAEFALDAIEAAGKTLIDEEDPKREYFLYPRWFSFRQRCQQCHWHVQFCWNFSTMYDCTLFSLSFKCGSSDHCPFVIPPILLSLD